MFGTLQVPHVAQYQLTEVRLKFGYISETPKPQFLIYKCETGLEKWLNSEDSLLPVQRTGVLSPIPMTGSSQSHVTLAPGESNTSSLTHLHVHAHACAHTHTFVILF